MFLFALFLLSRTRDTHRLLFPYHHLPLINSCRFVVCLHFISPCRRRHHRAVGRKYAYKLLPYPPPSPACVVDAFFYIMLVVIRCFIPPFVPRNKTFKSFHRSGGGFSARAKFYSTSDILVTLSLLTARPSQ